METEFQPRIENLKKYKAQYEQMLEKEKWRLPGLKEDGQSGMYAPGHKGIYLDLRLQRALSLDERIDKAGLISIRIQVIRTWIAEIEETIKLLESFVKSNAKPTPDNSSSVQDDPSADLRAVLATKPNQLLLVEGESDVEYMEMLRKPEHGENRLLIDGTIAAYRGAGALENLGLLNVITDIIPRVFITYDLDMEKKHRPALEGLKLRPTDDFCAIGIDADGKRSIEGLVPPTIIKGVSNDNPSLMTRLIGNDQKNRNAAKDEFKRLILHRFLMEAKPNTDDFKLFYALAKTINTGLAKPRSETKSQG